MASPDWLAMFSEEPPPVPPDLLVPCTAGVGPGDAQRVSEALGSLRSERMDLVSRMLKSELILLHRIIWRSASQHRGSVHLRRMRMMLSAARRASSLPTEVLLARRMAKAGVTASASAPSRAPSLPPRQLVDMAGARLVASGVACRRGMRAAELAYGALADQLSRTYFMPLALTGMCVAARLDALLRDKMRLAAAVHDKIASVRGCCPLAGGGGGGKGGWATMVGREGWPGGYAECLGEVEGLLAGEGGGAGKAAREVAEVLRGTGEGLEKVAMLLPPRGGEAEWGEDEGTMLLSREGGSEYGRQEEEEEEEEEEGLPVASVPGGGRDANSEGGGEDSKPMAARAQAERGGGRGKGGEEDADGSSSGDDGVAATSRPPAKGRGRAELPSAAQTSFTPFSAPPSSLGAALEAAKSTPFAAPAPSLSYRGVMAAMPFAQGAPEAGTTGRVPFRDVDMLKAGTCKGGAKRKDESGGGRAKKKKTNEKEKIVGLEDGQRGGDRIAELLFGGSTAPKIKCGGTGPAERQTVGSLGGSFAGKQSKEGAKGVSGKGMRGGGKKEGKVQEGKTKKGVGCMFESLLPKSDSDW